MDAKESVKKRQQDNTKNQKRIQNLKVTLQVRRKKKVIIYCDVSFCLKKFLIRKELMRLNKLGN